jgi:hypothetical protein
MKLIVWFEHSRPCALTTRASLKEGRTVLFSLWSAPGLEPVRCRTSSFDQSIAFGHLFKFISGIASDGVLAESDSWPGVEKLGARADCTVLNRAENLVSSKS